jgi:predicted RNase H-like HicB family nuclease
MQLTAAIASEGDLYVAQCLEVDVVSQGHSLEDARANLVEAVNLALSDPDTYVGATPLIVTIDVG